MTEAFAKQIETEARQAMTELVAAAKLKKGESRRPSGLRKTSE
mgnify:CR=1 FL=1